MAIKDKILRRTRKPYTRPRLRVVFQIYNPERKLYEGVPAGCLFETDDRNSALALADEIRTWLMSGLQDGD